MRFQRDARDDIERLRDVMVFTPSGSSFIHIMIVTPALSAWLRERELAHA